MTDFENLCSFTLALIQVEGPRRAYERQSADELVAASYWLAFCKYCPQHGGQTGPAEVGHADGTQTSRSVLMNGVDRNNMRVLQLGQRLRLVAVRGRDLEHDGPAGEIILFSEKDT